LQHIFHWQQNGGDAAADVQHGAALPLEEVQGYEAADGYAVGDSMN